jgi:hypothetical protein
MHNIERPLDPREKGIGKVQTGLLTLPGTAGYEVLALIGVQAELSTSAGLKNRNP